VETRDWASLFFGSSTVDLIDTIDAGASFHAALLLSAKQQNLLPPAATGALSLDDVARAIRVRGRICRNMPMSKR
jgi:hypothetical protein